MNEEQRSAAAGARAAIESGALRGAALLAQILAIPFVDRDAWVDLALGMPVPPADAELPRGAVPYLPCGVEEIIAAIREVPVSAGDDLVDLGSGLGRVLILAHLLSGAHGRGIEIQDHLVAAGRARCADLGLTGVELVHGDAAETELDGSVFFFYAPFNGELLARVARRLEEVARRRPIVVCAVDLALDLPWLAPRAETHGALTIYDSR